MARVRCPPLSEIDRAICDYDISRDCGGTLDTDMGHKRDKDYYALIFNGKKHHFVPFPI